MRPATEQTSLRRALTTSLTAAATVAFALVGAGIAVADPITKIDDSGRGFTCLFYAEEGHEIVIGLHDGLQFGQTSFIEVLDPAGGFAGAEGTSTWGDNTFATAIPLDGPYGTATIAGSFEIAGETVESKGVDRHGNNITGGRLSETPIAVEFSDITIGDLTIDLEHAATGCDGNIYTVTSWSNNPAGFVDNTWDFALPECYTDDGRPVDVNPQETEIEVRIFDEAGPGSGVVPRNGGTGTISWYDIATDEILGTTTLTLDLARAGSPFRVTEEFDGVRIQDIVIPLRVDLATETLDGQPITATCDAFRIHSSLHVAPE